MPLKKKPNQIKPNRTKKAVKTWIRISTRINGGIMTTREVEENIARK